MSNINQENIKNKVSNLSYWDNCFHGVSDRYFQFLPSFYDRAMEKARDKSYTNVFYGGGILAFLKVEKENDLIDSLLTELVMLPIYQTT